MCHRARRSCVASFVGSCVLLALAADLPAQRGGGKRRPEAVLERVSCYLVDGKLPAGTAANAGEDRVAAVGAVADARTRHELALVYLFDSKVDAEKRAAFEKTMFGNEELGIALRCFQTAHVDIAGDDDAQAKYGRRLPLFLAFDENGKQAGEASLAGYKATVAPVMGILEKAAGGHVKPTLAIFVKDYRDVVHDLEALDGKRKVLKDRKDKAADAAKKAEIEKELQASDAEEKQALANEKQLLEHARVPARDAAAKRFEIDRGGR
jgi:hypothetical protein